MKIKDQSKIAVSTCSCDLKLFSLPNLIPIKTWSINEQPFADEVPTNQKALRSLNRNFDASLHRMPSAISWWNENHLAVARVSGSISIHSIDHDLDSVTEAEWFQPFPLISDSTKGE